MPLSSASNGYNSEYIQAGNVRNRGIELSLGWTSQFGELEWTTTGTFSANQNRIVELIPGRKDPISKGGLKGADVYLREVVRWVTSISTPVSSALPRLSCPLY